MVTQCSSMQNHLIRDQIEFEQKCIQNTVQSKF